MWRKLGNVLTGLVMECKERENNKGPLVYRYKPIPTVDKRVVPPFLGKVGVLDKFRTIQGPLEGNLGFVGRLLEHVLDGFFGRLEIKV